MPGDDERCAEPERVRGQQHRAFETVPVSLASTRTAASTVPMHGAAQTANAPPSSAPEPRRRAPGQQPGRDHALRHRQQPDEREPDHDEHEAGDLGLSALREDVADCRRAGAEDDEDDGEPEDERHARAHDPPRGASLPEPSASTPESAER